MLTFGPLVSTLMAGPPDAMALESALHRLLAEPADAAHRRRCGATSVRTRSLDPAVAGAGRPTIVDLVAADGCLVELRRTAARG